MQVMTSVKMADMTAKSGERLREEIEEIEEITHFMLGDGKKA